ncbi:MAG TPA: hypothetical protein VFF72_00990 [Caldimonas sp.]|nr:hypothetical protein [Caldimonas sp.]
MNAPARLPLLRRGALAVGLMAAVAMLIGFYSIVVGAVEHGAHRRLMASVAPAHVAPRVATTRLQGGVKDATHRISLASASD